MTLSVGAELLRVTGDRRIEFRSANDPRLFRECLRVQLQLAGDDLRVSVRMIVARQVDEMDEDGAALHVTEELMAEAMPLVRSFDEAGDVGDDERLIVIRAHDAQVGDQRRERIVRNLRLGRADDRDQRRLAGVWQADDSDVGDQLQLDEKLALFAHVARLGEARRLTRGRREVLVSPPAAPTLRHQHPLALLRKVGENDAGVLVADH